MTQKQVFEYFKGYFPQLAETVTQWFANGKNSVRIRQASGKEYVFTFEGPTDWSLETVNHFAERLRGRAKM